MREAAPKMQARDLQLYDWSRGRMTVTSKGTLDDEEDVCGIVDGPAVGRGMGKTREVSWVDR